MKTGDCGKTRQMDGACNGEKTPASDDLNWMQEWPLGEIGDFGKNCQRASDNGEKHPDPLETGNFGDCGDFGQNRQRSGDNHNMANIQIGCQK